MNKIELLQKAQTESVPVLRRVTEYFRQLFPELKLQPNALERNPKADTFMTTNLEREYGEIRSITNDFVNTQTQNVETKIQSRLCEGLENPRAYQLQELGQKGEVVNDLSYFEDIQFGKLKQFKYGIGTKPTEEIIYDTNGNKFITTFDGHGKVLTEESIPNGFARSKTEFNSDGSRVKTIYQQVTRFPMKGDKGVVKIGNAVTTEERNAQGKLIKLTRNETNWDNNYESLIEINPENGNVVKFSLPGNFGCRNIHLKAEYTPDGFSCKSYKFSKNDEEVLNVVFDTTTGKPVLASGSYVDRLRERTNYFSGKPFTEEEILDNVKFNPVIYDNDVQFALIDSREIDHSLLDYLNAKK